MMWSASAEISAYCVGYIVFTYFGLVETMQRAFIVTIGGILILMGYLYGFHGNDLMMIGVLILTCKIGVSGAIQQAYIGTI